MTNKNFQLNVWIKSGQESIHKIVKGKKWKWRSRTLLKEDGNISIDWNPEKENNGPKTPESELWIRK